MQDQPALSPERRQQIALGDRYRELNMILWRIRCRTSGQAKEHEKARILRLRQEIAALKHGDDV